MQKPKLVFYALTANDLVASVFADYKNAIDELSIRIADDDTDTYGIKPVYGIWSLIECLGGYEDYDDDWMEEVIYIAHTMVEEKKNLLDQEAKQAKLKEKEKLEAELGNKPSEEEKANKNKDKK